MPSLAPASAVRVLQADPVARVEVHAAGEHELVRKHYRASRWLAWRSFLCRSRAEREFCNLHALHRAGVPCVRPRNWSERRLLGFVRQSELWTEFEDGAQDLRHWLGRAEAPGLRRSLARSLGRLLRQLHVAGYCSTTMSPRNVLVAANGSLLVCDQPHLVRIGRRREGAAFAPSRGLRIGESTDLFDAFFSPNRLCDWSHRERWSGLLDYCGGDRELARSIWYRLARRPRLMHRIRKGWLRGLSRVRPIRVPSRHEERLA